MPTKRTRSSIILVFAQAPLLVRQVWLDRCSRTVRTCDLRRHLLERSEEWRHRPRPPAVVLEVALGHIVGLSRRNGLRTRSAALGLYACCPRLRAACGAALAAAPLAAVLAIDLLLGVLAAVAAFTRRSL